MPPRTPHTFSSNQMEKERKRANGSEVEFAQKINPSEKIANAFTMNEKARFKKYIEEKDHIIINLLNEVTVLGKAINNLTQIPLENISSAESASFALNGKKIYFLA